MDDTKTTFRVPECNRAALNERIEKLARRAGKLNLKPPCLVEEGFEDIPLVVLKEDFDCREVECRTPDLSKHRVVGYRRYYTLSLDGEAPTIDGYKLVAVIEHGNTEVGNVLRVAPGMEGLCPTRFRQAGPWCEHCKTARRRQETFLLIKDQTEGVLIQVGRNCLADYLRDPGAAASLCAYAEIMESAKGLCSGSEDEDFFGVGGRSVSRVLVEAALAMTARIIRHCGWLSRTKARERFDMGETSGATADIVQEIFFNPDFFKAHKDDSNEIRALRDAARSVDEQDISTATAALAWIRDMRPRAEQLDDYLYNLLVVTSEETVLKKHLGILCSCVASHQREQQKLVEREREQKVKEASRHFGEEGKRARWTGTYLGSRAFEGESYGNGYGETVRYLHRFAVNNRDIGCWWTGTELNMQPGEVVYILGTVKKHEIYRETQQTTLSRCDVYAAEEVGKCPNCEGVILQNDLGKNCPHCKKRKLKVARDWFPAHTFPAQAEPVAS